MHRAAAKLEHLESHGLLQPSGTASKTVAIHCHGLFHWAGHLLKRLATAVGVLILLGVITVTLLAMSLPQGHALAPPGPPARPAESLREVKALATREALFEALHGTPMSLDVPVSDLSAVLQDLTGRWLRGGSQVQPTNQGQLELTVSVPIEQTPLRPLRPLGHWLNLTVVVGLHAKAPPTLDSITLGRLKIPPAPLTWVARKVLDMQGLLEPCELAVSAVERSEVLDGRLKLTVHWTDALQDRTLALVIPREDWPSLLAYHQRVLATLQRVPRLTRANPGHPLREVLRSTFILVQQRTLASALVAPVGGAQGSAQQQAYRETRAALVAVALAANHLSLHLVLPELGGRPTPALTPVSLRLRNREDFAQHYTISALMSLMLGSRVSDTIGLYKELMDANKKDGGSGFSFNDLALNRAGIQLGRRARQDPIGLIQRLGGDTALVADDDFIPQVSDLPEFLDRPTFTHRYGGVKDPRFGALMRDIEARVSALPVLR